MSYTIDFNLLKSPVGDMKNVSFAHFMENPELVISAAAEYPADPEYTSLLEAGDRAGAAQHFLDGKYLDEVRDQFEPMMSHFHILQREPTDEALQELALVCPNITIMHDDGEGETGDFYFIALTGGGMDFSEEIAYAYWKIDGDVPSDLYPQQQHVLSDEHYQDLIRFIVLRESNKIDAIKRRNPEMYRSIFDDVDDDGSETIDLTEGGE